MGAELSRTPCRHAIIASASRNCEFLFFRAVRLASGDHATCGDVFSQKLDGANQAEMCRYNPIMKSICEGSDKITHTP